MMVAVRACNLLLSYLIDLICIFTEPRWSNSSWSDGDIPDIISKGAPLKDTITVPIGGYVVTRFKADNPGETKFLL